MSKSSLHNKVLSIIKEIYPLQIIREEEIIKINGKRLFVDIYLPKLGLMIECDGIQHFKFNSFFHKDKWDLFHQKLRDEEKDIWCQKNNKVLVRFSYLEEDLLDINYVSAKIREKIDFD